MHKLDNRRNSKGLSQCVFLSLLAYKDKVHPITSDNGSEFAGHKTIAENLDADFYFAHPYASWLKKYLNI